ncbi:DUF5677 domain-containing protein [Ruminococcus sp. BSD2780120874_150323_B10]|uniref:DUF5677 domain-containing protein n=1 Tax=Ruminococcus sp. BSD2780120874_150323_B10 TaxID=2787127 RepID=UPI001899D8BA|nr:DUF5677 domain-containing protein [Ruminococcus sp. BSD2780120874_150323_B10]
MSISLKDHKLKKGKFISPWNDLEINMTENPWFQNRLPEYIWLALIFDKFERTEALKICWDIMLSFQEKNVNSLCMSELLKYENEQQRDIWDTVLKFAGKETISPLTIVFTHSKYPVFSNCFSCVTISADERLEKIEGAMKKASFHQTHFSTDIRFIVLYYSVLTKKLGIIKETAEALSRYPHLSHDDVEMEIIRPIIRSAEMGLDFTYKTNYEYLKFFWEEISAMTSCQPFYIDFKLETTDTDEYITKVKEIMDYYSDIFISVKPLDNKMLVLLGIATYSYKRLLELVNCNLYNEISGRSIIRVLIENYIMMKYLLKHESEHTDIWSEYQYYGIGQYKLIYLRSQENYANPKSHVPYPYLGILINEYTDQQFLDMDTKYFDKYNVREKAIDVGEKDLFGLYYDYDSAFEHGLWGAIRESAMLKCSSAGHQFHCIPDVENNQKLNSVWPDCRSVMNKTLQVLKDTYTLPDCYTVPED